MMYNNYNGIKQCFENTVIGILIFVSIATSPGSTVGLNLKLPLYLGGLDPTIRVSPGAGASQGFIGCVGEVNNLCIFYPTSVYFRKLCFGQTCVMLLDLNCDGSCFYLIFSVCFNLRLLLLCRRCI